MSRTGARAELNPFSGPRFGAVGNGSKPWFFDK